MKFHSLLDAQSFLLEIGKLDEVHLVDSNWKPTDEELKSFISQRSPLVRTIKNHRQSSKQKANWRENRYKIMRGIKSFHKSVDGKRFHRKLGRLLATRVTKDKNSTGSSVQDKYESLQAIVALKQHMLVELGYFRKLYEQVEMEEMIVDSSLPMLTELEKKVLNDTDLDQDEITFLADMVDKKTLLDEIAKCTGETFDNINKWCDDKTTELTANGINQDSPEFYTELFKTLILSANETKKL
jgi:hypothetical protein